MKVAVAICILGLAAGVLAIPSGDKKYTDRYDYINVQEVVSNEPLFKAYIHCILDKGKCTAEGKELKSHIQDAMENECVNCTDAQREGTKIVIKELINHKQKYWEELKAKYDPTGKYSKKYEDKLTEIKQ